jgi:sigma-B regulation protein RsbU (phosphoserine phosphatase)
MIPATEVGGDYFDYLSLGSDAFAVVVADVSGKGMPAALHVHKMQGVVQASRSGVSGAADILLRLQEHLGSSLEDASFVTAVAAVFDMKQQSVEIASAGHPPVFYKRGTRLYEVPAEGMIIGQAMGSLFSELLKPARISLEPGDMFFFYSDGIPEAMNSRQREFGFDRLKRVLAEAQGTSREAVRHCLGNIRTFTGDAPQSDDITMVAAKAPLGAKNR